jgi:hypothetical protein
MVTSVSAKSPSHPVSFAVPFKESGINRPLTPLNTALLPVQRFPIPYSLSYYLSSSSSMACISLAAWRLPLRPALAMPLFSRVIASTVRPAEASVCAAMK